MIKYSQFPRALEIQTASYCNSNCIICPYRDVKNKITHGVMSDGLFKKIISQIKSSWSTRIVLYFNNEPFLDPNIIERIKYINLTLPYSEIEISSNASLLDSEIQKKLLGTHISDLRLSVFGFTKNTHKKVMPGLDWDIVKCNIDQLVNNKKLRTKIDQISIVMIDYPGLSKQDIKLARQYCENNFINFKLWGFFDRSANVKKFSNNFFKQTVIGCGQDRPLDRLHVLFDGQVVLCCMDWKQEHILGNLNTENIQEIWDSKKYQSVRNAIYSNKGKPPKLCQHCILAK